MLNVRSRRRYGFGILVVASERFALTGLLVIALLAFVPTRALSQERSLAELMRDLQSNETQKRRDAAYEIGMRGPSASPAVSLLVRTLDDDDPQVWAFSVQALARIGPSAAPAVNALADELSSRSDQRRYRAAFALGSIGEPAVGRLIEGLENSRDEVRLGAALALSWCGEHAEPALPALTTLLQDDDAEVAEQASQTLGQLGTMTEAALLDVLDSDNEQAIELGLKALTLTRAAQPETIDRMLRQLAAPNAQIRAAAMQSLRRSQIDPGRLVQPAIEAIRDSEKVVRDEGVATIVSLGSLATPGLSELVELVTAGDEDVQRSAGEALGMLGEHSAPVLVDITNALRTSTDTQAMLLNALASIGPQAVDAVLETADEGIVGHSDAVSTLSNMGPSVANDLCNRFEESSDEVAHIIVDALGAIGHSDGAIVDVLIQALDHSNPQVERSGISALGSMSSIPTAVQVRLLDALEAAQGEDRATLLNTLIERLEEGRDRLKPYVTDGLADDAWQVRSVCVSGLAKLGLSRDISLNLWRELLDDTSSEVRLSTVRALVDLNGRTSLKIDWLVGRFRDSDWQVRVAALESLQQVGIRNPDSVLEITGLFEDDREEVVLAAIESVQQFERQAEVAVPALVRLSEQPRPTIRKSVANCLGILLHDAEHSVPALQNMLDDPDWSVRNAATVAIANFEEEAESAVPRLVELMRNPEDREAARAALRKIDLVTPEAIPALIAALEDEEIRVRYIAVYLLGQAGSDAKEALPLLKELTDSEDSRFRGFVRDTIEKIEGSDTP